MKREKLETLPVKIDNWALKNYIGFNKKGPKAREKFIPA
jgi:hypothetical protein